MTSILVVCTGNINRSPVAAAFLRRKLGDDFLVSSAGLAKAGVAPPPRLLKAAKRHELDLSDHRSSRLTAEMIDHADLVLCMDSTHPPKISGINADAQNNTFLLTEAIDRLAQGEWRPLTERVAIAAAVRTPKQFLWPNFPDVADPMGGRQKAFNTAVEQLAKLTDTLGNRIRFG